MSCVCVIIQKQNRKEATADLFSLDRPSHPRIDKPIFPPTTDTCRKAHKIMNTAPAISLTGLRIRIPDIDYNTHEFEYLTPTPEYHEDHEDQEDQEDQDNSFRTSLSSKQCDTPPPEQRTFLFYLHTGRINEILPSPPKFPVANTLEGLVPSHMTLLDYWRTQLNLTEDDLLPPIDWIDTA